MTAGLVLWKGIHRKKEGYIDLIVHPQCLKSTPYSHSGHGRKINEQPFGGSRQSMVVIMWLSKAAGRGMGVIQQLRHEKVLLCI